MGDLDGDNYEEESESAFPALISNIPLALFFSYIWFGSHLFAHRPVQPNPATNAIIEIHHKSLTAFISPTDQFLHGLLFWLTVATALFWIAIRWLIPNVFEIKLPSWLQPEGAGAEEWSNTRAVTTLLGVAMLIATLLDQEM